MTQTRFTDDGRSSTRLSYNRFLRFAVVMQSIDAFLSQTKRLKPDEQGFEALSLIVTQ